MIAVKCEINNISSVIDNKIRIYFCFVLCLFETFWKNEIEVIRIVQAFLLYNLSKIGKLMFFCNTQLRSLVISYRYNELSIKNGIAN